MRYSRVTRQCVIISLLRRKAYREIRPFFNILLLSPRAWHLRRATTDIGNNRVRVVSTEIRHPLNPTTVSNIYRAVIIISYCFPSFSGRWLFGHGEKKISVLTSGPQADALGVNGRVYQPVSVEIRHMVRLRHRHILSGKCVRYLADKTWSPLRVVASIRGGVKRWE